MMDKIKKALTWLKEKWFLVLGGVVGLVALFFVRPKNKILNSSRKNAQIDAQIFDLSEASAKKLQKTLSSIDGETEAKVRKLRNSKKKVSKKLLEEKDKRVKELTNKSAQELADLLKTKKD